MLSAVLLSITGVSSGYECPGRYFWVVRDGLTSAESIDELVDRASEAGANGLIVQVVGRAEAYYYSSILPEASFQEGLDPLAYLLARARPRGMEVHAWINAFLVWSAPEPPSDSTHVWHAHPDWFMTDRFGRSTRDYSRLECEDYGLVGATLSPAVPEVRAFLADIAVEIATGYDVDGIHLDYIRYPNPSFGFESPSSGAFFFRTGETSQDIFRYGSATEETSRLWSEWRVQQVETTVETIRSALRSVSPQTLLSCAVMADPFEATTHYSCDWRSWLRSGLVDFVCTMAYTTNTQKAKELAALGAGVCPERVIHGIGVYNQPVASALIGAEESLARGSGGVCIFSLNSLSDDNTWIIRNFWDQSTVPDHQMDSAVFHRVFNYSRNDQ